MDMSHYNKDYDTSHPFHVVAPYEPMGDQPEAIASLADGIRSGQWAQVLVGATGTGKTFTMAKLIEAVQKPTLVIAHNKTLAAQLCSEFKSFFPDNEVGYFVSYYDFYQPEAYIASTDTYIEKDASINDEIDKLRHSATMSLFERRDVIIVASVSCIYGLGDPEDYSELVVSLRLGQEKPQEEILHKLVDIQYSRNDMNLERGTFRVHGDTIEVFPAAFDNSIIRIEMFGDEIDRLTKVDVLTGEVIAERKHVAIYPASHYVTTRDKMERALGTIRQELDERLKVLKDGGHLLEAQRLEQRTRYDMEMMEEMGYCSGIENYSRHLAGRKPGQAPYTLLDYFPDDFLILVDESHVTLPQLRAMYAGDRSRKENLIEYGFRLPSALDNRPLKFEEFVERINQIVHDNYDDTPNGLPGNDDSGAMSSWLVFNMMGIYPVAGQNLYLVGSPMIPAYTIHLPNGKDLKVVAKGNEWNVKSQYDEAILRGTSLTHQQLLKGGTLVLPDCRKVAPSPTGHVVHKLNVDNIELVRQLNFLTSCSAIDESSTYTLHRSIGKANFILNRQYRNWEVAIDSTTLADTLLLRCNESIYLIPQRLVDEADGFCWDSPQKGKNIYDAKGTFLFVSRKAIQQLSQSGVFIYNGITWRQISQDASSITVKADVDGTLMQIATRRELPWVLRMENNPLGIDWHLVPNSVAHAVK